MRARQTIRSAWLVLLVVALATSTALLYTWNTEPRYSASGKYVIGPARELTEPETIIRSFDSLQGQGIVPTLVELLSSETIAARVGRPLGLDRRELEDYEVNASVLSASNTLELAVTGPDPRLTAQLARGIGTEASRTFEGLYSVYEIEPLDLPTPPEEPSSPNLTRNLVLAALLGLTAGGGLAFLRARERTRSDQRDLGPRDQAIDGADADRPRPRGPLRLRPPSDPAATVGRPSV